MPDNSVRRRLTVLDLVTLVAASAVGLGVTRTLWDFFLGEYFYRPISGWTTVAVFARAPETVLVLIPLATTWTFTLPLLRLRRPRPPLRRLPLQPGTAAWGAAILVLAVTQLGFLSKCAVEVFVTGATDFAVRSFSDFFLIEITPSTGLIACAILTAWMMLAVTGLGRPERSWIDRMGRVLGVLWIATAACQWWYNVTAFLPVDWQILGQQ